MSHVNRMVCPCALGGPTQIGGRRRSTRHRAATKSKAVRKSTRKLSRRTRKTHHRKSRK